MYTMTAEDPQATADPVDVDDLAATDDAPTVPELDPEAAYAAIGRQVVSALKEN